MKQFTALVLQVLAILAYTGSSLGNDGAGESLQRQCPITLDEGEKMNKKIFELGRECLETSETDTPLVLSYKTLDEHKDFFKSYCEKQPQIRECLADVASKSQSCQNETHHQSFQVFLDVLETSVEAGCVADGEVLAYLVMIFKHNSTTATNTIYFQNCFSIFVEKISLSLRLDISDLSRYYMFFWDIILAMDCFNGISEGDQHIKESIVSFLNEIVEKSKCFDPQNGSVVLCKNLDPPPNVTIWSCPISSADEQTKPLYDVFINKALHSVSMLDQGEYRGVNYVASRELSVNFSKFVCVKKNFIKPILTDVAFIASWCLNKVEQLMVQTLVNFLKNVLDHICTGNGQHLANVVFKVISDVANTTQDNALKECVTFANPPGEEFSTNLTSGMTLEYYRRLEVYKTCLLNKLQGDDVAVASAELILNGVINNMECPNPEQTALVLCETIDNTG